MTHASVEQQRESFNNLVATGTYDAGLRHPARAERFVTRVIDPLLTERVGQTTPVRVLDAGCGPGAWLRLLAARAAAFDVPVRLAGFDVADRMVEVARTALGSTPGLVRIEVADALSLSAYRPLEDGLGFDLVFAYDLIQQLPRRYQADTIARIRDALAPGGAAVVFDHERWSRHGLRMGWRKFATARLGLPLVPRYYCNARYPSLARAGAWVGRAEGVACRIVHSTETPKRALVVRKASVPTGPNAHHARKD